LQEAQEETKFASRNYVLLVQNLMLQAGIQLHDLDFIAASSGPAPFTTLRVSLASLNGLAFARQIPLVGVNGLECFTLEQKDDIYSQTLVLLNAFAGDLYVGLYDTSAQRVIAIKCMPFALLADFIREKNSTIKCVGGGAELYREQLCKLNPLLSIPEDNPATCSLQSVALHGLQQWNTDTRIWRRQLMPLYLKNHPVQNSL